LFFKSNYYRTKKNKSAFLFKSNPFSFNLYIALKYEKTYIYFHQHLESLNVWVFKPSHPNI